MRVRDLMSREVVTLERNDKLGLADQIMNLGRIRHMPVVDEDGRLCGVVSQRDLFRGALATALGYGSAAQRKLLDSLLVKEVMATQLATTTPDTPLVDAAEVMQRRKIGCLPVLDADGQLVGILTEADFVMHVARTLAASGASWAPTNVRPGGARPSRSWARRSVRRRASRSTGSTAATAADGPARTRWSPWDSARRSASS